MLSRAHVHSLKSGLTFWLLVVTISPAFSHDHPDGDKPHVHGLGIFSATSPADFNAGGSDLAPDTRHSHLLIFGVEIHVPASCPWAADQDSPLLAEHGFFQLGAELLNGLATSEPVCPTIEPQAQLSADISVKLTPAGEAVSASAAIPSPAPFLCDLARGLRSGAQQI